MSPSRLRIRISEAQRLMKTGPVPTAMTPSLEFVTIAALLPETSQIHLIRVNKQTFLTKGSEISGVSTMGLPVQLRIVRANGVNTAVTIFDDKNRSLLPLVVEFPDRDAGRISRDGLLHFRASGSALGGFDESRSDLCEFDGRSRREAFARPRQADQPQVWSISPSIFALSNTSITIASAMKIASRYSKRSIRCMR